MRAGGGRRVLRSLAVLTFSAVILAGCGGPVTYEGLPTEGRFQTPATSPGSAATPAPTRDASAPVMPEPTSLGDVREDPALLAILPAEVDGVPVVPEAASFADAVTFPDFVANVEAAAFAIAVRDPDLASGVIAKLRPGVWSDAFYRDWRDSYDEGACSQAGGVGGRAEVQLGGRTVHITTCGGGLAVYHAYLAERDVVVSVFSVGERRFGERLMAELRP